MKAKHIFIFLASTLALFGQNEEKPNNSTLLSQPIIASENQATTVLQDLDTIIITLQQKISENSQFLPLIFGNKKPYEQWQQTKQAIAQLHSLITQILHSDESIALLQRNQVLFDALKRLNAEAIKNAKMSKKDKEYIRRLSIVFKSTLFNEQLLGKLQEMEKQKIEMIAEQEKLSQKSKDQNANEYMPDFFYDEDYYDDSYYY
jgi:hypothetical protein